MAYNEIHQHPDGWVYVRTSNGVYQDTYENFELDFNSDLPDLPEGADEQIYTQGKRHCFMGDGNIIQGGEMPWPQGDSIIAKIQTGLANQAARNEVHPS